MEVLFETGYRVYGIDLYQFTPDGLEYVSTIAGSLLELRPNEIITNEDTYQYDLLRSQPFEVESEDTVEYVSLEPSLLISAEDFLSEFTEVYNENLLKVESTASVTDYEIITEEEGTFTWQLGDDLYLIGLWNEDNSLTEVAIYSDHSVPVEVEASAESSKVYTSAIYALISALGDAEKVDAILETMVTQQ